MTRGHLAQDILVAEVDFADRHAPPTTASGTARNPAQAFHIPTVPISQRPWSRRRSISWPLPPSFPEVRTLTWPRSCTCTDVTGNPRSTEMPWHGQNRFDVLGAVLISDVTRFCHHRRRVGSPVPDRVRHGDKVLAGDFTVHRERRVQRAGALQPGPETPSWQGHLGVSGWPVAQLPRSPRSGQCRVAAQPPASPQAILPHLGPQINFASTPSAESPETPDRCGPTRSSRPVRRQAARAPSRRRGCHLAPLTA